MVPSGFFNFFGLSDEAHIVGLDLPVINVLDYTWKKTLSSFHVSSIVSFDIR